MLKAYTWLTFCVMVWGSNFVFGKILVRDFSPTLLTMLRLLFIVIFLVGLFLYKKQFKRVEKSDLLAIIFLGVIGIFINQWSFFVGLQTADPTTSALILATTPILTSILAAIFLKEKLTIHMLMGSIVAIIGIYFVVTKGNLSSLHIDKGLLWIVLTMMTFAIMIIMTRLLSNRIDPLTITLYSNVVGLIVSVPFAFLLDKPLRISTEISDWSFLIGTAVVVHGIATLIWNNNIRHVDASKASILSNLEPFVAMIVGLILLSKPITGAEILGSLFIVGGVVLSTYQRKKLKSAD
ncbi:Permease of the drug/metabolite transporter (DMT) superfamily [Terribacillus halophilus]|uniref:Permease of the drug/metabolite transporter (DMT) superfamily n=1 Tax=Terribacillus halophilus TaxID=361279 RepID=A0A1G6QJX2_9BACI|nr:DMT family transporter [Terribacillus halophilus]SDC92598.1 Permease of the drug/metabolite transporter (DMT) superfamily [Terribacillus halophilus]